MKRQRFLFAFIVYLTGLSVCTSAQDITTIAGDSAAGYSGDGSSARTAELNHPRGVARDTMQNTYIADYSNSVVRKVNTTGIITTIAGTGTSGYTGDGGPADAATLDLPADIAFDHNGNMYIADRGNNVIRKINVSGIITTFAGTGTAGYSGDGAAAAGAMLNQPTGVAADAAGNVYIADCNNNRIRKVDTSGTITTLAGDGTAGFSGDGVLATLAELDMPTGVAVDKSGNVYIADNGSNAVRKVSTSGLITTVAGTGTAGYTGDGSAAALATLSGPWHVAADTAGNLYLSDQGNNRIRKVNTAGIITTIAGNATAGYTGDGGRALSATLNAPAGIAVSPHGAIYIADENNSVIREITDTGYHPAFVNGSFQNPGLCRNSGMNDISAWLAVRDSDAGETETFTLFSLPVHGTIAGLPLSVTSTGGVTTPGGITYTPATGFSGTDVFKIKVTDGLSAVLTTISVLVETAPSPGTISVPPTVCMSDTVSLAESVPGGLWSSTGYYVALTGTGELIGLLPGEDTVYYTVTNACSSATTAATVTVSPLASAGTIAGYSSDICVGDTVSFYSSSFTTVIDSGGTWSVSNPSASIDPVSGLLTGVSADTATVFFTYSNMCNTSVASQAITISGPPSAGTISGISTLCEGYLVLLTDTVAGGVWYSTNADATVAAGLVEAVAGGIDTIGYAIVNGCGADTATQQITIDSIAAPGVVTGPASVCVGLYIDLADTATGGVWSPSNANAAVTGSGGVLGISPGLDTISYIITNSCGTVSAEQVVAVDPFSTGTISGHDTVCQTESISLTESVAGGTWSSVDTGVATISASGVVTGISPGADSVYYTVTSSCGSAAVGRQIYVRSAAACHLSVASQPGSAADEGITIFPNPNNGTFSLLLHSARELPVYVTISSITGEKIADIATVTNKLTTVAINAAPGIYFLSASTEEGRYIAKIVVN